MVVDVACVAAVCGRKVLAEPAEEAVSILSFVLWLDRVDSVEGLGFSGVASVCAEGIGEVGGFDDEVDGRGDETGSLGEGGAGVAGVGTSYIECGLGE